jgi:flagellar biosynthesis/type III secretory pathway M-ring protein FliF/YscJ
VQHLSGLLSRWNGLPKPARLLGGTAALVAAAGIVLAALLTHPAQSALFATPLHAEQLAEVQERLASWNVAFTPLADNVVVDAARRNELLLRLSLAGVPHPHVESTREALASVGVLTPQAVIDAQTRAGLAGDLEAGLRGIDGVDDARVIVAPAKLAEFADESAQPASASVRLTMRTGARLSRAAVNGIREFVAAGVTGLDPARVTILDDRGIALGDGEDGEEASDAQTSLQSALDAAFGEGATIVRVHADLSARRVDRRDVRREPLNGAAVKSSAHSESYAGDGKRYQREDRTDDRGSETRETEVQAPPGRLERLSTAVFVDEERALDLAKVRALAAATVGFDARRGDALVVQAVDFHRARPARKDLWWLLYGAIVPLLPALVTAIAIVSIARIALPHASGLLRGAMERVAIRDASRAVAGLAPSRVRSVLAGEPPHAAAAIISALPAATAAAVLELYPQHERDAIVARMARPQTPLLGDPQEYLRRG